MQALLAIILLCCSVSLAADSQSPEEVWANAAEKRAALKTFHQEFEVSHDTKLNGETRNFVTKVSIDWLGGAWRERRVTGSGASIVIFDGGSLFEMEEGIDEFTRHAVKEKGGHTPLPSLYEIKEPDWKKATELSRQTCPIPGTNHECVTLSVPLKSWMTQAKNQMIHRSPGQARFLIDTVSGLLLQSLSSQPVETDRVSYVSQTSAVLKKLGYGGPVDAALFQVPANLKEVKQISQWDAQHIKKAFLGSLPPPISVKDLEGKPVSLADLRGKTVLLDFWTTWCPPCREDAPSIDKLYKKYGGKELAIVGFSVSEERAVVEKFLTQHKHEYPIVLTSENDLPRAFQVGVFPTYMVIDPDGKLVDVVEGEKGFGVLRGILKKAGLETE